MTGPVILAAGGTGGHMFPAEALARTLLARGRTVVLVTDIRGKAFGETLPDVRVERIRAANPSGGLAGKAKAALELIAGTFQAKSLMERLRPAAVVGFGGYPSVPTVFAAQRIGAVTVLHEQNAVLGRANRLLAGKATTICTSFPTVAGLPAGVETVRTGNPVRPAFLSLHDRAYAAPGEGGPIGLLVTGGSQGAAVFGTVVPEAVALLPEALRQRLRIAQQCREEGIEAARAVYERCGVAAELAPFLRDMPERLAACHLAICRAGASTVAEATVAGRPAILVPYPHAMDDHQTANARAVEAAGGAWLVPQPRFTAEFLAQRLTALLADPTALTQAAQGARAWAVPDAAARLADAVEQAAGLVGANGNKSPDLRRTAE